MIRIVVVVLALAGFAAGMNAGLNRAFADASADRDRAVAQAAPSQPTKAVDITGKWTMSFETPMGTSSPALEFKQTGENISGSYTGRYGKFPFEGTFKGKAIHFSFTMNAEGTPAEMTFNGEVAADGLTMGGQATLGDMGDTQWSAKKNPDK